MPNAGLYPLMLRIAGKRCLVVGGGPVAMRKVRGLLAAGARVRVVAPAAGREARAAIAGVEWLRRRFRAADVRGMALAFACTDDAEVNRAVARAADREGIPVNVADAPDLGTFHVPSVIRKGPLLIAISTGGRSPAFAKQLRLALTRALSGAGALAARIGRLRLRAMKAVLDPARRRRVLRGLVRSAAR